MKYLFFLFGVFLTTPELYAADSEAAHPMSLSEILKSANDSAPAVLLERLEARALRAQGLSGVGKILPELGVEGGGRSNREKEKRNDSFYYAYARYELSLSEIGQLRSGLAKKDLADLSLKTAKAKASQAIALEFFKALSLQRQIELKEGDLAAAEKQIVAAKKRIDGGLATESDLLEFRMHQNNLHNDLRLLKVDLDLALRDLERDSGLSSKISNLQYELNERSQNFEIEDVWTNVLSNNVELQRRRTESTIASAEKYGALGNFLPRLSAEGQYGKLQDTDFIESRKSSWAVVGKVTLPLFNGGSSARTFQEKSAEAERAEVILAQEATRMRQLAESLVKRQRELNEKFKGEQENVGATQKYFDMVMSEYRRGVKNSPDVAAATDKLFDAKWRLFESWRDLSLNTIELSVIQGKDWEL